LIATSTVLVI